MLTLNTNHHALIAQYHLSKANSALGQAIERLSSGKRINSAKDDPAGFAIANRMTANIKGLQQAARNANDGISVVQTAEGALDEVNYLLQRIRELSVQALNDTNNAKNKGAIQNEINQYLAEIDRISAHTQFNGNYLFSDGSKDMAIQVGAKDHETVSISLPSMNNQVLGLSGFTVAPTDDTAATTNPLATLDAAIAQVDGMRSHLGAMHNRFESIISNLTNTVTNLSAARSRIEDTDYALEVSNMLRAQIKQQVATMVLAQANQTPQLILTLLRQSLSF